jgi:hypothetical protein
MSYFSLNEKKKVIAHINNAIVFLSLTWGENFIAQRIANDDGNASRSCKHLRVSPSLKCMS